MRISSLSPPTPLQSLSLPVPRSWVLQNTGLQLRPLQLPGHWPLAGRVAQHPELTWDWSPHVRPRQQDLSEGPGGEHPAGLEGNTFFCKEGARGWPRTEDSLGSKENS